MSRTNKSTKGPGYEYWSRRNYKHCTNPGSRHGVSDKDMTTRYERRVGKQNLKKDEEQ